MSSAVFARWTRFFVQSPVARMGAWAADAEAAAEAEAEAEEEEAWADEPAVVVAIDLLTKCEKTAVGVSGGGVPPSQSSGNCPAYFHNSPTLSSLLIGCLVYSLWPFDLCPDPVPILLMLLSSMLLELVVCIPKIHCSNSSFSIPALRALATCLASPLQTFLSYFLSPVPTLASPLSSAGWDYTAGE